MKFARCGRLETQSADRMLHAATIHPFRNARNIWRPKYRTPIGARPPRLDAVIAGRCEFRPILAAIRWAGATRLFLRLRRSALADAARAPSRCGLLVSRLSSSGLSSFIPNSRYHMGYIIPHCAPWPGQGPSPYIAFVFPRTYVTCAGAEGGDSVIPPSEGSTPTFSVNATHRKSKWEPAQPLLSHTIRNSSSPAPRILTMLMRGSPRFT